MLLLCLLQLLVSYAALGMASTWSEWWGYEGISGPDFWGLVNSEQWWLCNKGKQQSPIDIVPADMLFDPSLKHFHMDKHRVSGTLMNTGHDVRVVLDESSTQYINITGGPLSYQYRISEIIIHFGSVDSLGSEHTINGQSFPAEIQILAYNTDIYGNFTQAVYSSHGIAMIALFVQVAKTANPELEIIAQNLKLVRHKGKQQRIRHLSVHGLLPDTPNYITYEGSLTQPGCYETVTWIIMNKPIYMTSKDLLIMRDLMQGEEDHAKLGMENNCRPTMPLYQRTLRTNINFINHSKGCTMEKDLHYQVLSGVSVLSAEGYTLFIPIVSSVLLATPFANSIWDRS